MKIRYNREIISGAIFVVLSAVLWFLIPVQVQTLEKTPKIGRASCRERV